MQLLTTCLVVGAALLPSAHGWTWTWHDRENQTHIEDGTGPTECAEMAMTRGMQYHWNPMEENLCIEAFSDDDCGTRNGYSCGEWGPRSLGQAFVGSWRVSTPEDALSSTGIETRTATSTQTRVTGTRNSTTPATSASSSSRSTSTSTHSVMVTEEPTITVPPSTSAPSTTPTASPGAGSSVSGGWIPNVFFGLLVGAGVLAL